MSLIRINIILKETLSKYRKKTTRREDFLRKRRGQASRRALLRLGIGVGVDEAYRDGFDPGKPTRDRPARISAFYR
jgi:hypothetical protein